MNYVFPGLTPFFDRAAAALSGRGAMHINRCNGLWHSGRIQESLGQLPRLDPPDRGLLLAHAHQVRDGLALALAGIDLAIEEVEIELGMVPLPDLKPIRKRA
jgi:hypothetical protein